MGVEEEFLSDLLELLRKWKATLSADDHYQGWPECGQDIKMTVDIPAIYNSDNDCIRPYTEIDLGGYVDFEERTHDHKTDCITEGG